MRLKFLAAILGLVTVSATASAQHGSPDSQRFELKLVFDGPAVVEFKPHGLPGTYFINGVLATGKETVFDAKLPVKFHLRKTSGEPIRFSSKDCTVSVLDSKGEMVPGSVAMPHVPDPKTGFSVPKIREFILGDTPVVDDPELSLFGYQLVNPEKTKLKSGQYTVVCCYAGRLATLPFTVKNP